METKTITLPKTTTQVLEYSLFTTSFLIPFLISGPQLLTGTIVNALLFLFALKVKSKSALPIVILPSIGALLNGILFGRFTVFLLYFLPFIWVGNYVLVQTFSSLTKKNSLMVSVIGSSLFKCGILFATAYTLTLTKIVPMIFLQSMGLFQLATALVGGMVALFINTIISQKHD
ncbi:MAG: hypothetical protein NTV98_00770 [Candidatus Roizmanbacteria bacterium]|nr:hypothetical protein [Candidatus Roizmanbacteria bacterium]